MHTGNTILNAAQNFQQAVYPCVYREHVPFHCRRTHGNGLSLCVQGTSLSLDDNKTNRRFIPVCTGNICLDDDDVNEYPVYPCVYREH